MTNLPHIGKGMWKLKDTIIENKKWRTNKANPHRISTMGQNIPNRGKKC